MKKKWIAAGLASLMSMSLMAMPILAEGEQDTTTGSTKTTDVARSGKKAKPVKKEKVAEPENAIGKASAKEKALADAGLTLEQVGKVRSRVSTLEDGTIVYKVRFTYDGQKYSYKINALTGELVDKTTEAATNKSAL